MTLQGIIFEIDGTLVDPNPSQIQAWHRAFQRFGFDTGLICDELDRVLEIASLAAAASR